MRLTQAMLLTSVIFSGAIFGFFYAWVCSTMWGLDQLDPVVAIKAMNAMNISVRNPVFFPAFFLTPVILLMTAAVCWKFETKGASPWLVTAAILYLAGAFAPTALVNVPMNDALKLVDPQAAGINAQAIWSDYSTRWQFWNTGRTLVSGLSLLLVGWGMLQANRP